MNKTRSSILLVIFSTLVYNFYDFNIKLYLVLLLSYFVTSILFGIFALYENAQNPPLQSSIFWIGFTWPIYMIAGFFNKKSDHNKTGYDN